MLIQITRMRQAMLRLLTVMCNFREYEKKRLRCLRLTLSRTQTVVTAIKQVKTFQPSTQWSRVSGEPHKVRTTADNQKACCNKFKVTRGMVRFSGAHIIPHFTPITSGAWERVLAINSFPCLKLTKNAHLRHSGTGFLHGFPRPLK